jgi:hypothetical protein
MNVGRFFLISDWTSDCHWDFTDETGDEYRDFFSLSIVKRQAYPEVFVLMMCLGPLCILLGILPKQPVAEKD